MKNTAIRNRIVRTFASFAALAVVSLILPLGSARISPSHEVATSAHNIIQLADGSESNGGKGGKGSAKLTGVA